MPSQSPITLPYGTDSIDLYLPTSAALLLPPDLPPVRCESQAIREALQSPIASQQLRVLGKGARTATIVINDITRPTPSRLLVEAILEELALAGVPESGVTLLVATGNHRPNTPAELEMMLGKDLCGRLTIVNHDGADHNQLVHLGATPRGVAIEVNRLVVEPDLTILTGNIGPHQTAGFSGGRKSIMPGVASHEALRTHHSPPVRSLEPIMGRLEQNAFHEEAVAAARIVGVDFIINTVKNSCGEIVDVVAGDLDAAHIAGVEKCKQSWQISVNRLFDAAVVSPGGYPKDIDLHQAQKAIAAAEIVTREGGPIILIAECRDGTGKFAEALRKASSPPAVVKRFLAEGFQADEHTSKAYLFARALLKHPIYIISDRLPDEEISQMFMTLCQPTDDVVVDLLRKHGATESVAVAPYAVDCLFSVMSC